MKTIVEIHTCECGKNIIVLDENLENATDTENMQCPVCGGEMESEMIREIEINRVTS